jgi:Ni/Fe-hydrogenase subunit HybB-like protein
MADKKKNKKAVPAAETEKEPTPTPAKQRKPFKPTITHALWAAGILGLLIGSIGLFQRFTEGLRPTALGSYVPWGLWVATYEYLVWLEVGSLLVFTLLVYVLQLAQGLERMAPTLYSPRLPSLQWR